MVAVNLGDPEFLAAKQLVYRCMQMHPLMMPLPLTEAKPWHLNRPPWTQFLKMKLVETSGNEEKRKGNEYETGNNELETGKLLLKRTYLTCSLPEKKI